MSYNNVVFESEDGVGILTINRPKALNALNIETIGEIRSVLDQAKKDSGIKVLIITGAGDKAFVAGADIGEIKNLGLKDGFDFLRGGHQMNREIESMGKPTIAAVNGMALGGGCELALACTLRVVSDTAKMGLPELGLGVIPGYGGTQRLARLIGKGRALYYLLTGDMIGGEEAARIGLANFVVKPEELMAQARKIAKKITTKGPLAVKMALFSVNCGTEVDIETGLMLEAAMGNLTIGSKDKEEGIAAFLEKRPPVFKGE